MIVLYFFSLFSHALLTTFITVKFESVGILFISLHTVRRWILMTSSLVSVLVVHTIVGILYAWLRRLSHLVVALPVVPKWHTIYGNR